MRLGNSKRCLAIFRPTCHTNNTLHVLVNYLYLKLIAIIVRLYCGCQFRELLGKTIDMEQVTHQHNHIRSWNLQAFKSFDRYCIERSEINYHVIKLWISKTKRKKSTTIKKIKKRKKEQSENLITVQ